VGELTILAAQAQGQLALFIPLILSYLSNFPLLALIKVFQGISSVLVNHIFRKKNFPSE